jgi:tRNA (guanine-N7-)-methyltransferase
MKKAYPASNYKEYRPTTNPYFDKIREFADASETLLADANTELFKGNWRKRLGKGDDAFLQLELGAYHGETSIHLAKNNPDAAHLGVEWKYKQCFKAGKKAKDIGLKNLTFLRANIARLTWMLAPGEVDRVWVLFPDPWSKAPQQKWRVLRPDFFRILGTLMTTGKELMIKTDHAEYAEHIAESIKEAGCFDEMKPEQAKAVWDLIPPTPFERIFLRQKLPIYSFSLVRNNNIVALPEEVKDVSFPH